MRFPVFCVNRGIGFIHPIIDIHNVGADSIILPAHMNGYQNTYQSNHPWHRPPKNRFNYK